MLSALHVVTSTQRRGAEVAAIALHDALGPLGLTGEVVALAPGGDLDLPTLGGGSTRSPTTLRALRRRASEHDVVVAHGSDTLLACALGLAGSSRPFVYRLIGDPAHWSSGALRRWRVRVGLQRSRAVVALDQAGASTLCRDYAVREERIVVIPNAVDPGRFPLVDGGARAGARRRLGLEHDDRVAAVVGALSPEKAPELAVAAALDADEHTVVVVAGDGPLRDRLPSGPRVRVLGSVPDVRPVYAAADVVVLASRTEGVPAVAIEAALCGIPVAATDVGGTAGVVTPDVGLLVPAGDGVALTAAVAEILRRRRHDGVRARQLMVERYSMRTAAVAWAALFRDVAETGQ